MKSNIKQTAPLFTRVNPALLNERTELTAGWFVISHRFFETKKERREAHGKWFKITSEHGSVYRILRFAPQLAGSPKKKTGDVVIDYQGWLALWDCAEDVEQPLNLTITRAKWWVTPKLAVSHPDPIVRLAGALGFQSVALGTIGVILGVIALL